MQSKYKPSCSHLTRNYLLSLDLCRPGNCVGGSWRVSPLFFHSTSVPSVATDINLSSIGAGGEWGNKSHRINFAELKSHSSALWVLYIVNPGSFLQEMLCGSLMDFYPQWQCFFVGIFSSWTLTSPYRHCFIIWKKGLVRQGPFQDLSSWLTFMGSAYDHFSAVQGGIADY